MAKKKKVPVKKHKREYKPGKTTDVKKHTRNVTVHEINKSDINKIKTGTSKQLKQKILKKNEIFDESTINPNLRKTRGRNNEFLYYQWSTTIRAIAKAEAKSRRGKGNLSYYFVGSFKGVTLYRLYSKYDFTIKEKIVPSVMDELSRKWMYDPVQTKSDIAKMSSVSLETVDLYSKEIDQIFRDYENVHPAGARMDFDKLLGRMSEQQRKKENLETMKKFIQKELNRYGLKPDEEVFIFNKYTNKWEPAESFSYTVVMSEDLYVFNPYSSQYDKIDTYSKKERKEQKSKKEKLGWMKNISNWKLICRDNRLRIYLNGVLIYNRKYDGAKKTYDELTSVKKIKQELEVSDLSNQEILEMFEEGTSEKKTIKKTKERYKKKLLKNIPDLERKISETRKYLDSFDDESIASADCYVVSGLTSHALNKAGIKNEIVSSSDGHYYVVFKSDDKEYFIDPTARLQGFGDVIGELPEIDKNNKRFYPITVYENGVETLIEKNSLASSYLMDPEMGGLDNFLENTELNKLVNIFEENKNV